MKERSYNTPLHKAQRCLPPRRTKGRPLAANPSAANAFSTTRLSPVEVILPSLPDPPLRPISAPPAEIQMQVLPQASVYVPTQILPPQQAARFAVAPYPGPKSRGEPPSLKARSPRPKAKLGLRLESFTMIGVNLLLTTAAVSGVVRLLPVQVVQYTRLQMLNQQVELLGNRVNRMQEGLDRGMDPLQQEALIKERLNLVPPNQIQVRMIDPASTVANDPDLMPEEMTSRTASRNLP